jgi:hypothetical protein
MAFATRSYIAQEPWVVVKDSRDSLAIGVVFIAGAVVIAQIT